MGLKVIVYGIKGDSLWDNFGVKGDSLWENL